MPKIKKFTPDLKGDFLISGAPFRVRGNSKNQNVWNLKTFWNLNDEIYCFPCFKTVCYMRNNLKDK